MSFDWTFALLDEAAHVFVVVGYIHHVLILLLAVVLVCDTRLRCLIRENRFWNIPRLESCSFIIYLFTLQKLKLPYECC